MSKNKDKASQAAELRRLAEQRLREREAEAARPASEPDTLRLLHELQVHQIELEMQNEELTQAQAEVEAGLERYTDLYDFAPVGYFTLDRDGIIRQANITGAGLLGIERSKLVHSPFGRFVAPDESDRWDHYLAHVLQSAEQQTCELKLTRADGSTFYVRLDSICLDRPAHEPSHGGPLVIRVAMSDITERKQIDEAQQFLLQCGTRSTGEDFFRSLARYLAQTLAVDFVCIDHLVGDGLVAKTVAMYDNGEFQDNVEYALKDTPCGDVVGKTICCFPKGVRQLFPKDKVLQEMTAESYVGTTLWGFDGKPIGLIALIGRKPMANPRLAELVLRVVAVRAAGELERAQIDETLRASEARYRSYIEVTGQLGWTTNAAGEVVDDLPSWRAFTGQTMQEVQGWGWSQALHPDDVARTAEVWRKALADRRNYETEYRIRRQDGEYRHFLRVPVFRGDGTVREWVGTCIDITDRKQVERALEQAVHELERSNQDLEQFAYVASHDLQEPLRHVTGFMKLLEDGYKGLLDAKADEYIRHAADGAKRMSALITALLAYSRVSTGDRDLGVISCQEAMDRALASLKVALSESNARVTHDPLPAVLADRTQVAQLFQNLIGNALKFRREGVDPEVHVGARREGDQWVLWVRDNGIGIDPRQADRVFVVFQRLHTREKYPGTGIGLAICKKIVERHGGRIWVESKPCTGSTFFFTIPAVSGG